MSVVQPFNAARRTRSTPAPYAAAVDLSSLTPDQAKALANRLQPMLGYMARLTDRMLKSAWCAHDPAYVAAWKARDAMHELLVRLRYASCAPGCAGKPGPAPGERRPWGERGCPPPDGA